MKKFWVATGKRRRDTTIICRQGQLWITWKNGRDIILSAGEKVCIRNPRKLLVESYLPIS